MHHRDQLATIMSVALRLVNLKCLVTAGGIRVKKRRIAATFYSTQENQGSKERYKSTLSPHVIGPAERKVLGRFGRAERFLTPREVSTYERH